MAYVSQRRPANVRVNAAAGLHGEWWVWSTSSLLAVRIPDPFCQVLAAVVAGAGGVSQVAVGPGCALTRHGRVRDDGETREYARGGTRHRH